MPTVEERLAQLDALEAPTGVAEAPQQDSIPDPRIEELDRLESQTTPIEPEPEDLTRDRLSQLDEIEKQAPATSPIVRRFQERMGVEPISAPDEAVPAVPSAEAPAVQQGATSIPVGAEAPAAQRGGDFSPPTPLDEGLAEAGVLGPRASIEAGKEFAKRLFFPLGKSGAGAIKAAGGFLNFAGRTGQPFTPLVKGIRKLAGIKEETGIEKFAGSIGDPLVKFGNFSQKTFEELSPTKNIFEGGKFNKEAAKDPKTWTDSILNAFGSMSIAIAGGGGSVLGSSLVGAVQEAAPMFEDLKAEGMNEEEAATRALAFGTVVGLLNKISFGKALGGKGVKNAVISAVTEAVTEFAEEPAQAIASNLARKGVSLPELGKRVVGSLADGLNVILPTLITGFGLGGAATQQHIQQVAEKTGEAIPTDIQADIEAADVPTVDPAALAGEVEFEGQQAPVEDFTPPPETGGLTITQDAVPEAAQEAITPEVTPEPTPTTTRAVAEDFAPPATSEAATDFEPPPVRAADVVAREAEAQDFEPPVLPGELPVSERETETLRKGSGLAELRERAGELALSDKGGAVALEKRISAFESLPELTKLRRNIHALRAVKGMPRSQLRDAVRAVMKEKNAATPEKRVAVSLSGIGVGVPELQQILQKIKAARPKSVGNKRVLTLKTERKIDALKSTLIQQGEMSNEDFKVILDMEKVDDPHFTTKERLVTETQGNAILRRMTNISNVIKDQNKVATALQGTTMGEEVGRIENVHAEEFEGKPAKSRSLLDMHHYADSLEKQTGIPFGRAWQKLFDNRHVAEGAINDKINEALGGIENIRDIRNDEAALGRINDYIASRLPKYVKGKPTAPSGITAQEKQIADNITRLLKDFESDVRYLRFYDWLDKGTDIPDAPARELTAAKDILESDGDQALKTWLEGRDWGVIRSGYDIGEVVKPTISSKRVPAKGVSSKHLNTRESVSFRRYERDIISRFVSYVRQMTYKTALNKDIRGVQELFEQNRDLLADPSKVAQEMSGNMREILGQKEPLGPLEKAVVLPYSQAARTIFLDVKKGVRNLFQNLAFFTKTENLVRPGKLSEGDQKYFDTFVSQEKGIAQDFLLQEHKINVPGIKQLNEAADFINVMGRTDRLNRMISYRAMLGATRRAFKNNPDYTTNPESLKKMMKESGFAEMEAVERTRALEALSTGGEDAMSRYVARAITQKVHFLYERSARSPAEQGSMFRKVMSNLLTFRKGFGQRLVLDARKLSKAGREAGKGIGTTPRALRSLIGATVGASFVGLLYKFVTGDDRNPYAPDQILGQLSLGGLSTGAQEQIGEFTRNAVGAVKGDKQALDGTIVAITRGGDMFLPFYDETLNVIEASSDLLNADKQVLRELRGVLDDRYTPRKTEADRSALEAFQHGVFGTEPQKNNAKKKKTTTISRTPARPAQPFKL